MGFDSCQWLVDYLLNPSGRTLELVAVVIAQTGNESVLIQQQMEQLIFPLLRLHGIRTVQIARAGSSLRDGFVVLDDTRSPTTCHIRPTLTKPYWSLGESLLLAAAVPQYSADSRFCSENFKIKILEKWHKQNYPGYLKLVGFNADEISRILKARRLNSPDEMQFPLHELGRTRPYIEGYMLDFAGGGFYLSACTFCPFSQISGGAKAVKGRWEKQPIEAARAAYLEYVAICFNPKQTLSSSQKSVTERQLLSNVATELLELELSEATWRVYHVRRIRSKTRKMPYRSVRPIYASDRKNCEMQLRLEAARLNAEITHCHHGIARAVIPTSGTGCEAFLVAAPGDPRAKQIDSFQSIWDERHDYEQYNLF
jgi:hypothetical protein